ncbi:MAG TPA: YkgJ family cysteine cluster protein, partial [Terriglobales bacterium]|nr:YkgJ family cysteine cluster protein [Terriglobales bacterium]
MRIAELKKYAKLFAFAGLSWQILSFRYGSETILLFSTARLVSPSYMTLQNLRMRFACQPGCTRCCTQEGWIWLGAEDVPRLAAFRGMSTDEFKRVYVYSTKHTSRLRMKKGTCPFLEAEGCSVHPAKPTQCRAFPFWPEILENKE